MRLFMHAVLASRSIGCALVAMTGIILATDLPAATINIEADMTTPEHSTWPLPGQSFPVSLTLSVASGVEGQPREWGGWRFGWRFEAAIVGVRVSIPVPGQPQPEAWQASSLARSWDSIGLHVEQTAGGGPGKGESFFGISQDVGEAHVVHEQVSGFSAVPNVEFQFNSVGFHIFNPNGLAGIPVAPTLNDLLAALAAFDLTQAAPQDRLAAVWLVPVGTPPDGRPNFLELVGSINRLTVDNLEPVPAPPAIVGLSSALLILLARQRRRGCPTQLASPLPR